MNAMAKLIMVQGTSSNVGKSILVTALCRIFKQDGYKVAPFKSQNMALNAFVTQEGGEIGRAQAVQAEACGIAPSVDMNPILMKPEADSKSQIVVNGKVDRTISAREYYEYAPLLLDTALAALNRLREQNDIVVIEGAGSPAEINLRQREIVNMRIAKTAGAPVLLAGDIDRGGVFASLIGTIDLLEPEERGYVKGYLINKFRGDASLLKPAIDVLEDRTSIPVLGIIPYLRNMAIAQEDSVYLDECKSGLGETDLDIAVIRLPRISNYDDFDALATDGASVRFVSKTGEIGNPDLIIIPGTKSTIPDMEYLWQNGLAETIIKKAGKGTHVLGVCGGYQILGKMIYDPHKTESETTELKGLGLLDTETTFEKEKSTTQVSGQVRFNNGLLADMAGCEVGGYEIHMGRTRLFTAQPAFQITKTPKGPADYLDGASNAEGTVLGTYIHGIFESDSFRRGFLNAIRRYKGIPERQAGYFDRDKEYDKLADIVRARIDMNKIYDILNEGIR